MPASVPDVLLLHGALGAAAQFAPLIERLAAERPDLRLHTLDFEGHGAAPPADRPYAIAHFAENGRHRLDALGIARAHLVGYSMGGYVALALAAEEPARVASVLTLGTKFEWDPATAAREAARLDPATIAERVPRFAQALAARHQPAGGWEAVVERTAVLLRALGDAPVLTDPVLAAIDLPVRVVVGDRDATVSVAESAAAARRLPAGELAVLPRTPHPLEQVPLERLVGTVADFLPSE